MSVRVSVQGSSNTTCPRLLRSEQMAQSSNKCCPSRQSAPCESAQPWADTGCPQAGTRTCDRAGHDARLQVGTCAAGVYAVLGVQRPERRLAARQLRGGVLAARAPGTCRLIAAYADRSVMFCAQILGPRLERQYAGQVMPKSP